jgi:shikimate 5-dehydrogenase
MKKIIIMHHQKPLAVLRVTVPLKPQVIPYTAEISSIAMMTSVCPVVVSAKTLPVVP